MSCIILPPGFILPPYHFAPYHFASWKSFNVHYLPMSRIILPSYHFAPPPPMVLPPGDCFMIYTIYPCPVSFCPLDSFCPLSFCPLEIFQCTLFTHIPFHFAPISFCPQRLFHDLHYLPMSRIICPLDLFCPHIILPPRNGLMIYTIYPCLVSCCHCIRLRFHTNKKPFTTKAYDRRASGDCGTSGYY